MINLSEPDTLGYFEFISKKQFRLLEGEVHFWYFDINTSKQLFINSIDKLNIEEQVRINDFLFSETSRLFTFKRGILRHVLEKYTGVMGKKLEFYKDAYGKLHSSCHYHLGFSISQSDEILALILGPTNEIGIDIEKLVDIKKHKDTISRYLTKKELNIIRNLKTNEDQQHAFLSCWTRKEAFLKALGFGLSIDPQMHELGFSLKTSTKISEVNIPDYHPWRFVDLHPTSEVIGAIVMKDNIHTINSFYYSELCI